MSNRHVLGALGMTASFVLVFTGHAHAQAGTWHVMAPLSVGRAELGAEAVDGLVYAIGGVNGGSDALATEAFDPTTGTWTSKAPLQPPPGSGGQRAAFATAMLDGKIYAFGGGNGLIFFDDVQAYDPATDTWNVRNPMPTSRAHAVAAAMNGKIYLIGGHVTPGGPNAPTFEYDPISDTWTERAPMLTHRINPGIAVLNGKFFVIGGATTGSAVITVEVYDPSADEWSAGSPLPSARMNPAVQVVGSRIYAFGGVDDSWAIVSAGAVYDPTLDVWSEAPALPAERTVAGSAVLDGVMYLMGGQHNGPSKYAGETFAFTPSSPGDMDSDEDGIPDGLDRCPNVGAATADGCPSPLAVLRDAVNSLDIPGGNRQALLANIEAVEGSIARGNLNAARGAVGAFVNKIDALRRSRRLSSALADALIAQALLLIPR